MRIKTEHHQSNRAGQPPPSLYTVCEWSCSVTLAIILKKHLLKQTRAHDCARLRRHEQRKNMTKEYRKRSCGTKLKEVKENFMSLQRQVPASSFCVCVCSLRLSRLIGFLWVSITARTAHHLSHVSWNPSHSPLSFPLNSLDYFLLCRLLQQVCSIRKYYLLVLC